MLRKKSPGKVGYQDLKSKGIVNTRLFIYSTRIYVESLLCYDFDLGRWEYGTELGC